MEILNKFCIPKFLIVRSELWIRLNHSSPIIGLTAWFWKILIDTIRYRHLIDNRANGRIFHSSLDAHFYNLLHARQSWHGNRAVSHPVLVKFNRIQQVQQFAKIWKTLEFKFSLKDYARLCDHILLSGHDMIKWAQAIFHWNYAWFMPALPCEWTSP